MPSLPDHRLARIALLTSLYFAQGLPFGFFTQAFPVILRQRGHDLAEIGLVGLLNLPWALKFLWSPLVDRWQGSPLGPRRGWIVPLQVASLLILLALAVAPTEDGGSLFWIGVAFLGLNVVAATQDIATDALAVNLLRGGERGLGNGVQVGGYRLGMIVGGGFLLVLFTQTGWSGSFAIMAGLMAFVSLPVWLFREPASPVPVSVDAPPPALGAAFGRFLRRPGMAAWLGALCLYKAGDAFASTMIRPFLVDLGLALGDVGWLLGTAGSTAALLGAAAGGALLVRLPRRGALLGFGVLQLLSVAVWLVPALTPEVDRGALYAVSIFEHFAGSMATVALFTAMMDACEPRHAGTDYTVQACVVVIATGVFGATSGFSARALGFAGHFALASLLCAVGLAGVAALTRKGLMQAPVR
jgi:PAT family beta-lactamase induction signal transducer AmpG